ncbi:MAG: hypothetical protein N3E49_05255 [Bacteroidia bacterium]|nr:hypothetical protein [Bacteroidia bacterium]
MLVWLLPAATPTHYDILGEALEEVLEAISNEIAVWGISYNPAMPGRGYTFRLWNGRGRLVGFYGRWPLRALAQQVESLWSMESFKPQVILPTRLSWAKALVRRWQRRLAAQVLSTFPLPTDPPLFLPGGFFDTPEMQPEPRTICLFTSYEAEKEAAYIADLLALSQYCVYLVGTPKLATPFRQVAARFPSRVHLRFGLPWMESRLYADRASVLLAAGAVPDELIALQLGRRWIVPHNHPMAPYAWATYTRPEAIPELLTPVEVPSLSLSLSEFSKRLISCLRAICS